MNLSWSEQLTKEPVMKPSNFMPFFWSWETRGNGRFGLWPSFQHFHIAIVHLVWWVVQPEQGTEPRTALRDRDLIASKLITAAERKRWNLRSWCQGGLLGLCCSGDTRPSCSTWGWGSMSTGGFGHRSLLGGLFCVWRQTIVRAKLGFTLEEMTWRARNAGTSHDRNVLIAPTTKRIW